MEILHLTPAEFEAAKAAGQITPDSHDYVWADDGSVTAIPLRWHDDASYLAYQGA